MVIIDEVLNYKNEDITWRFCQHFDISIFEAEEIFQELKKWLWLCATAAMEREQGIQGVPEKIIVDDTILILDEMWHNFICFTKDYNDFCLAYFGRFIHHFPATPKSKRRLEENLLTDPSFQINERKAQYGYIYDKLGEGTLIKWYDYYANNYSSEIVKTLRKK